MYVLLITIIIGLFAGLLFLNIYFRVKVIRIYRKLVENRVQFGAAHFFNPVRLEEEVMQKYPEQRENIETFISHIRYSMRLATILIALITLFGAVLMYYR